MQATIKPSKISGLVKAPASKSMMQRVCAAALLHKGTTVIHNPGYSEDDKASLHIIQQLGAKIISQDAHTIIIESNGVNPTSDTIDCDESGLAARLFTPIAALAGKEITITGRGSLLNRSMGEFAIILPQLGVELQKFNGGLPFKMQGHLQAKDITINGDISSQYLSGLLFAFAFSATKPVTIQVQDLKSKPYIDLTLQVLKHFGKDVAHDNYTIFHVIPSAGTESTIEIAIEGDWSNASYWLVAAATNGDITIEGLDNKSVQADKEILGLLQKAGAQIQQNDKSMQITAAPLREFEFDATDCPDLFPALAILAAKCKGESYIKGIHRLWHKESNRIESITEMLHQLNIHYSIEDDALCVRYQNKFDYATIDSYNDHRIAMAAGIGALLAKGPVTITGAEAVNKSYPDFFKTLISLGANCEINDL